MEFRLASLKKRAKGTTDTLQKTRERWLSFFLGGALFVGVLVRRAVLFGVYIKAPDFWKLPHVDLVLLALELIVITLYCYYYVDSYCNSLWIML